MQGVDVQPLTANMLTPESLSELLGGPDIEPPAPAYRVRRAGRRTPTTRTTRCRRRGTRSRVPLPGPAPGVLAGDPLGRHRARRWTAAGARTRGATAAR